MDMKIPRAIISNGIYVTERTKKTPRLETPTLITTQSQNGAALGSTRPSSPHGQSIRPCSVDSLKTVTEILLADRILPVFTQRPCTERCTARVQRRMYPSGLRSRIRHRPASSVLNSFCFKLFFISFFSVTDPRNRLR